MMRGLGATTACPDGQVLNPFTQQCEVVFGVETITPCPAGQHTDPVTYRCAADVTKQAQLGPVGWAAVVSAALVGVSLIARYIEGGTRGRRRQ